MDEEVRKELLTKIIQDCKYQFEKINHLTKKIIDGHVSRTDQYAIIARVNKMASTMEKDLEDFFGLGEKKETSSN